MNRARYGLLLCCMMAGVAGAQSPVSRPSVDVRARLEDLTREVSRYRVDGDLRTHLLMRLFDDAYVRASVACLVETEARLQSLLPNSDSSPADRETIEAMLQWTQEALSRVQQGLPASDFIPDRVAFPIGSAGNEVPMPVTTAWVSGGPASETPEQAARRLDLISCLGAKLFVEVRPDMSADMAERMKRRAEHGGMAFCYSPAGPTQAIASLAPPIAFTPLLVDRVAVPSGARGVVWPGVIANVGDFESVAWASRMTSLAAAPKYVGAGRIIFPEIANDPVEVGRWRTALWEHVLAGCRLLVFTMQAGSDKTPDEAWNQPWIIETTAHCAIDFLRLSDVIQAFSRLADVAVFACAGGDSAAATRAARRHAALWNSLAGLAMSVDPIGPSILEDETQMRRYRILVIADPASASPQRQQQFARLAQQNVTLIGVGDVPATMSGTIRFGRIFAWTQMKDLSEYVAGLRTDGTICTGRVYVDTPERSLLSSLRAGSSRDEQGRALVYLINRSSRPIPVTLMMQGKVVQGHAQELIADRSVDLTNSPVSLPPCAVWILRLGS